MDTLTVLLKSTGNPDHREYYGEGVLSPTETVVVKTINEARLVCRKYITKHDLGAGNWTGGEVRKNGTPCGRIHHNGNYSPI